MPTFSILALLATTLAFTTTARADDDASWYDAYLDRVTKIQSEQPRWVTPLVTVTPRLEQEFRTDFVGQQKIGKNETYNFGNGKGLELIPLDPVEVIFNVPPYIEHNSRAHDGFGDFSTLVKYRLAAGNESNGNYILTAFLGATFPTGTDHNGLETTVLTPTFAGGKGFELFETDLDVQSTLGVALPTNDVTTLGHTLTWNTTLQAHVAKYFWPEIEDNYSHFFGGEHSGNTQNFITPGMMFGRFAIHERTGFTAGGGYQIATTNYNAYNHAWVASMRVPF